MVRHAGIVKERIGILADGAEVRGELVLPEGASALVLLVADTPHGVMAPSLNGTGLGTLELSLLSSEERGLQRLASTHCCEVPFLANRLTRVTDWLLESQPTADLRLGYFGEANDAAVVMWAAAERAYAIDAIVTLSGRLELATPALPCVRAPTLVIVPAEEVALIQHNRAAMSHLRCERQVAVLPSTADQSECAASLASDWFKAHLQRQEVP
jgi:putative phosphoribosyl transferase